MPNLSDGGSDVFPTRPQRRARALDIVIAPPAPSRYGVPLRSVRVYSDDSWVTPRGSISKSDRHSADEKSLTKSEVKSHYAQTGHSPDQYPYPRECKTLQSHLLNGVAYDARKKLRRWRSGRYAGHLRHLPTQATSWCKKASIRVFSRTRRLYSRTGMPAMRQSLERDIKAKDTYLRGRLGAAAVVSRLQGRFGKGHRCDPNRTVACAER